MEWDLGPKLPEPLWGHCSVMFGGNLVVIGGWSTSQRQYGNKLDSMTSAYVLTGSSWTSLLPLRHGRSTHGCTVTNFRVKDWYIIYMMSFRFNNQFNVVKLDLYSNVQEQSFIGNGTSYRCCWRNRIEPKCSGLR